MSKYWDNSWNYSQPTTSEIKQRSAASLQKSRSAGKSMEPVTVTGTKIARSWWGQAWCANLEQYADYESRLDRGKRYVKSGAVVDLKIQKGKILARVQGSRKTPYKVEILISPMSEEKCKGIMDRCGKKPENMEALLNGSFPEELQELFRGKDGLFPEPKEISFHCSCPDWALMCKHVAAALYGVGTRLDEDPALFFALRGIDMERFIDVAIANRVEAMLQNASRPSSRIMEAGNAAALFGALQDRRF